MSCKHEGSIAVAGCVLVCKDCFNALSNQDVLHIIADLRATVQRQAGEVERLNKRIDYLRENYAYVGPIRREEKKP
jgi:hypothetical protein